MWILQMVLIIVFIIVTAFLLWIIVKFSFLAIGVIILIGVIAWLIWMMCCNKPFW